MKEGREGFYTQEGADPKTVGEDPRTSFCTLGAGQSYLSWERTQKPWVRTQGPPSVPLARDSRSLAGQVTQKPPGWLRERPFCTLGTGQSYPSWAGDPKTTRMAP